MSRLSSTEAAEPAHERNEPHVTSDRFLAVDFSVDLVGPGISL